MAFWARLGLQGTKVGNDAIYMEVDKGLLAFFAEEEGAVGVGGVPKRIEKT